MAGRRESGLQGTRLEGILAGVRAMFPESVPGERHGLGSVRGSHEESARMKLGILRLLFLHVLDLATS